MTYAVRRIEPGEWRQLRALRLEALQDSPTAFGTTPADAAALADEVWQQQAEQAASSPTTATFIAVAADGRWVGMAGSAPVEVVAGTYCIQGVYVTPAHRGRAAGLAARLVDAAITWARDVTDASWLTLGVHEDNERAQAFYRRIGFTGTGKVVPCRLNPARNITILGYEKFRLTTAR
ncbi:GNAT family N-acetyltransferase [Catellatospora sp. NPDC049133]|jgi:RimJ/RimL family protein N-acetyltransferase|uniref:GNAT family N-acetyltransferase n=1 Tax=Catellatospora sp. NPDC049133 TaxID=3155499 RepID=UPI0033E03A7A